ncbi:MAG: hypothetical protein A3F18_00005 [Legionellales bacterium RIFCSPHIGHO2_12_FULL_37_14]|nr:MAG: hypothetical protein A3F18_00005 [Legionellales bacterium RIFCSPHIGHO2_12_FULL_37_14]
MSIAEIQRAALSGDIEEIKRLESGLNAEEQKAAVMACGYAAIQNAVQNGHIEIIKYLESHLSAREKTAAVVADDYVAIRFAAHNGHTETIKYLASHLSANEQKAAVMEVNYAAIRNAAQNGHTETFRHFLTIDTVLAYAEAHVVEYGSLVNPYIRERIADLRMRKLNAEANNPQAVFDVGEEEALCIFYMIRNLIRRGADNPHMMQDDIVFLLEIPAVKALAGAEVNGGNSNELLRLALSLNNRDAAEILLNIPVVRDLAEANDYYASERRGELDLRALARNRESAMTGLTQGEQRRLAAVNERYKAILANTGINNLIDDLRLQLKARFLQNPATITMDDGSLKELPVLYTDFIKLKLSENEKARALEAYYSHKDHTALRYLSKPNRWMHEHASYVYVDNNEHSLKYSTFEEYQPLIALLYCAARDENIEDSEDFTPETRFAHFIDELSHIGRAHNWDRSRERDNKSEEYDDLEGDRPSCYSGVKRRLFQAVLGHPLLIILTKPLRYNNQPAKPKISAGVIFSLVASITMGLGLIALACVLLPPVGLITLGAVLGYSLSAAGFASAAGCLGFFGYKTHKAVESQKIPKLS